MESSAEQTVSAGFLKNDQALTMRVFLYATLPLLQLCKACIDLA